jgi:hypothetical protein
MRLFGSGDDNVVFFELNGDEGTALEFCFLCCCLFQTST